MQTDDQKIQNAVMNTRILRAPKQSLYTFGSTSVYYYLLTEPAYTEVVKSAEETVIREGRVIAERPRIVTPYYLSGVQGFSPEALRYFERLTQEHGPSVRGVLYTYRNESKGLTLVSDNLLAVVDKINDQIDRRGDPLAAIIKGEDALWDVSLMKFIFELTRGSLPGNLSQFESRGLLDIDDAGIPADARARIEELFAMARKGDTTPAAVKEELDRWGLFEEYQDSFFGLFHKGR